MDVPARRRAEDLWVDEPRALRPTGLPPAPRHRGDSASRTVLAGQRGSRSPRRGGGADGGRHSADADLSLPHRAAPDGGRRGLAAPEPVGAGVAPLLLPVGLDARQRAVRGRRGGRARHLGRHRDPGPADARRPEGPARPRALPPPMAGNRRRPAGHAGPAGVRPAVRHRGPARHRARRRRGVAGDHAPLDEDRDGAVRRAGRLRRGGHLDGADDRPPRLPVGRHRAHLRRGRAAHRRPRGDPDDRSRGGLHRPAEAPDPLSGELSTRGTGGGADPGADPALGPRARRLRGAAGAHPARRAGARAARVHAPGHAGPGRGDGAAPRHPHRGEHEPRAHRRRHPSGDVQHLLPDDQPTRVRLRALRRHRPVAVARQRPAGRCERLAGAGRRGADHVHRRRRLRAAARGQRPGARLLRAPLGALRPRRGLDAAPGLDTLRAGFRADDSIKRLLVSIAGSDLFRRRPAAGSPGGQE